MDYTQRILENFWLLSNDIAPYILLGTFIAGALKLILPDAFITKHIGKENRTSIIKTALIGIPLPLCSCSVIPFATALKKNGASKSALQTFLISAPISGVDSILVTQGAFGTVFALYRVITSFFVAIAAGFFSLWLDNPPQQAQSIPRFSTQKPASFKPTMMVCVKPANTPKLQKIWNYGYHQIFKDIAKPLFIGLILASLVSTFIPVKLDNFITQNLLLSYTLMIVIALPLYVCATSSVPLGMALMVAGFSPGSAFVFLSAGPATSIISMGIVKKLLGNKGLVIYLSTIVTCSFLFAYVMDLFLKDFIDLYTLQTIHDEPSLLSIISSFILWILLAKTLLPKAKQKSCPS